MLYIGEELIIYLILDILDFNWSIIAAIFSALAALGSWLIAVSQFKYLKIKESGVLGLSSSFEEISLDYKYSAEQFRETLTTHYFILQNLSVLQINLIELELEEDLNKNKKAFFQDSDDNPAFRTLGFPMQPIIKDFQEYYTTKFQWNFIRPDEYVKVKLPLFILREFIHASYKIEKGKPLSYNNYIKIKVKYFDKVKSKLQCVNTRVPYEIKFEGARVVIKFNIEPVVINL